LFADPTPSRRKLLKNSLATLAGAQLAGFSAQANSKKMALHHTPKAKSIIFCYMSGGVSHVDSFDPKAKLLKLAGKPMPVEVKRTQFDNNGNIYPSPWKTKRWGESGLEMTTLFPEIASHADDIAIVRSMTAKFSEHAQGNFFMHSGFPFLGHPSAGAWINYGLGSENPNLPGNVVLKNKSGVPHGGVSIFGNGYLPATTQGSFLNLATNDAVPHIKPKQSIEQQRKALDLISQLDKTFADKIAQSMDVQAMIDNMETAFQMQASVPELTDISRESKATKKMYGMDSNKEYIRNYGQQCLAARRLVERGVRFIELTCASAYGKQSANPWDQHGNLEKDHFAMAKQVDQPIAGLIKDLKSRGLLESTLIVFTGEFGRTPFSQGSNGRDHNPYGFSLWLAGGGVKGGTVLGATDELGYHAVEDVSTVYDLWATVLHQLGVNHEKLTYLYSGRNMRLTDVHGHIWKKILA
jgi:uncharacterized protein (DUF1501 family)